MFPERITTWFSERGIKPDTLKEFCLWWNGSEIVIPIGDGKKYRRDPHTVKGPKYHFETGCGVSLYNFKPDAQTIIIVEGELDTIRLHQEGFSVCSSTGGAASFSKNWVPLFEGKEVFICFDNDIAGAQGAARIANFMPGTKIIPFPRYFTGKDVTDYMKHHTADEFKGLMKYAYMLPSYEDNRTSINKALDACVGVRRKLFENDLSAHVLEEHITTLNNRKRILSAGKQKVKHREEFESVKDIPIPSFLEFTPSGFAKCIWHTEKSPSLKYYPKTNSVYCFGCQKSGDVINVVRTLQACTFEEAIKILKES